MASKPTHTKTQHRPADRVGASLPPRVSGEALGEVEVAVSECRGAEALSLVLRWWGEGDAPQAGVVFEASRKNPRRGENSCLFPVRVDEHGLGRYLRDARLLRFDVVAHGRVVGALKVPHGAPGPRARLARVRLVVRMRSKSRVRSALKPRGALVGSFDGPAAAAAGPPRETAARKPAALASTIPKVGLKSKFYKDPEATGVALPVGTAGTLGAAKRRKKPPLAATYRQPKPTANPWGPGSDDDDEPDAAAATAEVAPPVDEVERFVEGDMTAPPPREAVEDDARWTVEDDAAEEREEAVLEGLLRRGEALREQIARAEYSTPSRGDDAVTAFVDAELDAATRPPPTKPPPPESESELSDDEDRDEGRAFATAPATRATGGMAPSPPRRRAGAAPLRCLLRPGLRLDRGTAATCGRARVAHRWSLPNAPERRRATASSVAPADGARGAYALGPYDCAAPFAVDDAFRVGRAVQVVEVWAEAPDGAAERLIGLAKLRGEELAAALDRERRRVVRAQRLFDVAAGADARLDEWLLDGGRGRRGLYRGVGRPAVAAARGAVDATLALGTPSQLAALEDARAFDKAAKIQSLLRALAPARRAAAAAGAARAPAARPSRRPADVAFGAAAVRHVLEVAAVGPCRLPGARGGATVSYAVLGGEPASLWWDGDSPQLNSRSRHDRDDGASSGTFPLAERPERGVSFVAEVEAVLVFGDGGALEFRSQPFRGRGGARDGRRRVPGAAAGGRRAALLRAAAAAPPPAPPRSVAAAPLEDWRLTVVVGAELSVPPFRPETPTEDWRWSVSWRSLDGRHAGDTAPAAGALRPDGLFAVAWAAEFAAELPVAALRDGALAFDVLVRAKHAPNAAKLGSVTVDLGLLACGMTRLDGSYQLSDDFRRDRGALRLKIGAAAGAPEIAGARFVAAPRAAPVVAAARPDPPRLAAPVPASPGRGGARGGAAVPEPAGRPSDAAGPPSGLPSLAARPAATGLRASTSSSDAVSTSDASGRTAPRRAAFATAETERIARIMRGGWAAPG
ncbi:ubiquitin-protein transferase [Aureococcus anophagefferens]|nr:ubiquitin-protein transferase [Aureococcus anophagefferens]